MYVLQHDRQDHYQVICGDCLDIMPALAPASVDLIISDLPYGASYADWDVKLPMGRLWANYERLIKGNGAIVLTATQPFGSLLVASKPDWFRCEWIWDKATAANFANAKKHPLRTHESVMIFARGAPRYFPIMVQTDRINHSTGKSTARPSKLMQIKAYNEDRKDGVKYPISIQRFPKHSSSHKNHPTEKPVELIRYFVESYSQPGDVVLDNCMGSGTTLVACMLADRRCIGIEKDREIYVTAVRRFRQCK